MDKLPITFWKTDEPMPNPAWFGTERPLPAYMAYLYLHVERQHDGKVKATLFSEDEIVHRTFAIGDSVLDAMSKLEGHWWVKECLRTYVRSQMGKHAQPAA